MKNSDWFWYFSDFWLQMKLRLKLLLRDKMACLAFFVAAAGFFIILRDFNLQAEERASIPIGVVNSDFIAGKPTKTSDELIEGLKQIQVLYVYEGTLEELKDLLYDGYISSIFVIEPGYEERIRSGNRTELVTVYQGGEDQLAMVVSDIVAGEMMYQICLSEGVEVYRNIPEGPLGKHSYQEYQEYAANLMNSGEYAYSFSITYLDVKQDVESDKELNNSLLYRQMLVGIAAMLYSFVVLFAVNQTVAERENGLFLRKKLTKMQQTAQAAGDLGAVLVVLAVISSIFSFCMSYYLKQLTLFVPMWLISMLYNLAMGCIFLLLGRLMQKVTMYQLVGVTSVIVLGIGGFCTMVEGILIPEISILQMLPNSWFIQFISRLL